MVTLSTRRYRRPTAGFLLGNDIEHFLGQVLWPQTATTENSNAFTLVAELPSVKKGVSIAVENGFLTITAEKPAQSESGQGNSKRRASAPIKTQIAVN